MRARERASERVKKKKNNNNIFFSFPRSFFFSLSLSLPIYTRGNNAFAHTVFHGST
jgi:hypothetical protein